MAEDRRKRISALFADVVGSTQLGERVDPETFAAILSRFWGVARATIERHGGTIKYAGDGVIGFFGVDRTHEDDSLRAVRAAVALLDAVADTGPELMRDFGERLTIRVGVNTGEALIPGDVAPDALGDTVNVAQRLESAAPEGRILIGPETFAETARWLKGAQSIELEVKGRRAPVRAWTLSSVADQPSAPPESAFVARAAELEKLMSVALHAIKHSAPSAVLIVGEAGIGKTRLINELRRLLRPHTRSAVGHCHEYGQLSPYRPLLETLAGTLRSTDPASLRVALLEALKEESDRTAITEIIVGLETNPASPADIAWAVRRTLEALARSGIGLVVLDGLQWARPELLDIVDRVGRELEAAPLALVLEARPELFDPNRAESPAFEYATWLEVDPLDAEAARSLMTQHVDLDRFERSLVERVLVAASGNPLYLEQIARDLADRLEARGRVGKTTGIPVPQRLRTLLLSRIDNMTEGERRALERASVAGMRFEESHLERLLDPPERAGLKAVLSSVERNGIVERETAPGIYRFRHELWREALYEALPKQVRAELHQRCATIVTDRGELSDLAAGEHNLRAHRLLREVIPGSPELEELAARASSQLRAAGHELVQRGHWSSAVEALTPATELDVDRASKSASLLNLGVAQAKLGQLDSARDSFGAAAAAGNDQADVALRARLELELLSGYAGGEGRVAYVASVAREAIAAFERTHDEENLARAWRLLADAHWTAAQYGPCAAALESALRHARSVRDVAESNEILVWVASAVSVGPTPAPEALRRCSEIRLELAGVPSLAAEVDALRAYLSAMINEQDVARELIADSLGALRELGLSFSAARRRLEAGWVELLADDPRAAERELRQGLGELESVGEKTVHAVTAGYLGQALYQQDNLDDADSFASICERDAASDDIAAQVVWRTLRGKLLAANGDAASGREIALAGLRLAESTDALDLLGDAQSDYAEIMLTANEREAADSFRTAQSTYERKGNIASALRTATRLNALTRS